MKAEEILAEDLVKQLFKYPSLADIGLRKHGYVKIKDIRQAVANYMHSEGCSCCRDCEQHDLNREILGKLLNVPKFKDGIGYNFKKFIKD